MYDCMDAGVVLLRSCLVGELCVGDIKEVGDPEEVLWRLQFNRRRI